MSDNLRHRIVNVVRVHGPAHADFQCAGCDWENHDQPHSAHVADALIRELGWRMEREFDYTMRINDLRWKRRYVTDWEADA